MVKNLLWFVLGAAAGVAASYKVLKDHFDEIANEEINKARMMYTERAGKFEESKPEEKTEEEKEAELDELMKEEGYVMDNEKKPAIYIIEPIQFGDSDDPEWRQESITYHKPSNNYEDEYGELMSLDTVEETIGLDARNHFGEYELDSVFIRNENTRTDYELLLDLDEWEG